MSEHKETTSSWSAVDWVDGVLDGVQADIPVERSVALRVNGELLVSLHCTPDHLDDLAAGFLLSQAAISRRDQITGLTVSADGGTLDLAIEGGLPTEGGGDVSPVMYSGCGQGISLKASEPKKVPRGLEDVFDADRLLEALNRVLGRGEAYRKTRGIHSAALLSREGGMLCHREDIGRHNALDKVLGWAASQCLEPAANFIAMSGRISADAVAKVVRFRIPLIVAKGVPTSMALEDAGRLGLTVVSSRGARKLRIYTHGERVRE